MSTAPTDLPTDVRLMLLATSLLGWVAVGLVLWAMGLWAVRHPIWNLSALEVHGDLTHQNEATFRAHVGPGLRGSFLTLSLSEVQTAFQSVPWVRSAVVQRQFPNRIRVTLEEHRPVAWWEQNGDLMLLNRQGEVFEASAEDDDTDALPELAGPEGQALRVKELFDALAPAFAHLDMSLQRLELTAQGSWRARLDNEADIELGRGSTADIQARVDQFTRTLTQVTRQHNRSLASADLRYPSGYALRLQGITTLEPRAKASQP